MNLNGFPFLFNIFVLFKYLYSLNKYSNIDNAILFLLFLFLFPPPPSFSSFISTGISIGSAIGIPTPA
jgi:hypothetical protein